jgi:hypothetical protein
LNVHLKDEAEAERHLAFCRDRRAWNLGRARGLRGA